MVDAAAPSALARKRLAQIGLGSVQFGLAYGATNQNGMVGGEEIQRILATAKAAGLSLIDTSTNYGQAEQALGAAGVRDFAIVTKTPVFKGEPFEKEAATKVKDAFRASLDALGKEKVYGLLAHHGWNLMERGGEVLWAAMESLQKEGRVEKIGASVYTAGQTEELQKTFPLGLVQLPSNALDQRFVRSGMTARLKKAGTEIHVRSLFLQGVLLAAKRPAWFETKKESFAAYDSYVEQTGLSRLSVTLGYAFSCPDFDRLILGMTTAKELEEAIAAVAALPDDIAPMDGLAVTDETLLNPSLWPTAL